LSRRTAAPDRRLSLPHYNVSGPADTIAEFRRPRASSTGRQIQPGENVSAIVGRLSRIGFNSMVAVSRTGVTRARRSLRELQRGIGAPRRASTKPSTMEKVEKEL
jgi:hypothetical protein